MKAFITTFALLCSVSALADYNYDYTTGNSYNTVGNTTYGSNVKTGSTWTTTTNGDNSYGTDSKGNSWNYNSQSGTYWNSNGKICTGKGANRVCTGGN